MASNPDPVAPGWRDLRIPGLVVGTLLLSIFAHTLPAIAGVWFAEGGYYQHAPLVPFVCGWLVWRDRERLRDIPPGSNPLGLVLVLVALWVFVVGLLENSATLQRYALFAAIFGSALVVLGTRLVRATWFMWAFALAFMIPFSPMLLDSLTVQLKLTAAQLTYGAVDTLGFAAVRLGDSIHFSGGRTVLVDDVCSGLRSLVTLMAVASLFAYLQTARWKRWLIVALAVPIAIAANSLRVFVLCLFAARGTPVEPGTALHEVTGVAIYLVAMLLLYGIHMLPEREPTAATTPEPPAEGPPPEPPAAVSRRWLYVLIVELIVGFGVTVPLWGEPPRPTQPETLVTEGIPYTIANWRGRAIDRGPVELLPKEADSFLRRYTHGADAGQVDLFVFYSSSLAGVHPPPGCYLLQGFVEEEQGETTVNTGRGELRVNRSVIRLAGTRHLVYYWFRLNGARFLEEWPMRVSRMSRRLTFRGESRDGATIRISTRLDGDLESAEARLQAFAAEALGAVLEQLP